MGAVDPQRYFCGDDLNDGAIAVSVGSQKNRTHCRGRLSVRCRRQLKRPARHVWRRTVGFRPATSGQGRLAPELLAGGQAEVQTALTSITQLNGIWNVYSLAMDISSEMPNGPWFSTFSCQRAST
jgi:hypothetical protein